MSRRHSDSFTHGWRFVVAQTEPHGWLCSETLATRSGDFEFVNGYPTDDTAQQLRDLQMFNRATEVYLTQLMPVSEMALRQGLRAFGASKPTQVVVWEQLMDAKTVLLTANTETVYAISHLALKDDGPTVIEAPPRMLGFIQDGLQRYLADIGPLGADKGAGGKFLVLPPDFDGDVPDGFLRGALADVLGDIRRKGLPGRREHRSRQSQLMNQIKVYPLAHAASPPTMEFLNGSGQDIDTLFPDDFGFFELLAMIVDEEPAEIFGPLERWLMQAIGIEKGTPFQPDPKSQAVLVDAARLGGAMARVNTYAASAPDVYFYPDRKWQGALAGVELHLPQRRRTADRCPQQRLLHGRWQFPGDDGEERRAGFAVPLDLP